MNRPRGSRRYVSESCVARAEAVEATVRQHDAAGMACGIKL